VIVLSIPFFGELSPMLEIARNLVDADHDVTVVTGSRFEDAVHATGAAFVPLVGVADFDDRNLAATFPTASTVRPGPEQLNLLFEIAVEGIPAQSAAVDALLQGKPDSVLVANSVSFGAWPSVLGAPVRRPARWIAVGANPLTLPSADTGPFGPAVGPDAAAKNRAAWEAFQDMLAPSSERARQVIRRLGSTEEAPRVIDGLTGLPDEFVALTVAGLEFPRHDLPSHVSLIGALPPADVPEQWVAPEWWADLDDGRPVVVVTQGTLANGDLSALVLPTIEALAGMDLLVVATLGRDAGDTLGALPANARVAQYIPYRTLLPRAAAYVTNGGFGGTQQALRMGVPVVIAGDTDDKPLVAARVAYRNVGVDLRTGRPDPSRIKDAVLQVLSSADITRAVADLAREYHAADPFAEIQRLIRKPAAGRGFAQR
jgi:UDP:flavonoid glycosyltransferase YjiC (YdhE family)